MKYLALAVIALTACDLPLQPYSTEPEEGDFTITPVEPHEAEVTTQCMRPDQVVVVMAENAPDHMAWWCVSETFSEPEIITVDRDWQGIYEFGWDCRGPRDVRAVPVYCEALYLGYSDMVWYR